MKNFLPPASQCMTSPGVITGSTPSMFMSSGRCTSTPFQVSQVASLPQLREKTVISWPFLTYSRVISMAYVPSPPLKNGGNSSTKYAIFTFSPSGISSIIFPATRFQRNCFSTFLRPFLPNAAARDGSLST